MVEVLEAKMTKLLDILLPALMIVESGGDPAAIGDKGLAIGAYQIHRAYWTDGTESLKVQWPYSDAYRADRAAKVVRAYLLRYGRAYERKTGRKATLEVLARLHNGGPAGWKKHATVKYWKKVEKQIAVQKST